MNEQEIAPLDKPARPRLISQLVSGQVVLLDIVLEQLQLLQVSIRLITLLERVAH